MQNASNSSVALRFDLSTWLMLARRQAPLIFAGALIGLLSAIISMLSVVPQFTSSSLLLVDSRRARAVQDAYVFPSAGADGFDSLVVTQIEVLKSDQNARWVANTLNLQNDTAFMQKPSSHLADIFSMSLARAGFASPAKLPTTMASQDEATQSTINRLKRGVDIRRIGRAQVLQISYTHSDAVIAAKVANGFAISYIADQAAAKTEAGRGAIAWLKEQLGELRTLVQQSELAVQKFKNSRGLVSVGGQLLEDTRFADANTQLASQRAEISKIESRLEKINTIIDQKQMNAVVTESLGNAAITHLRTLYIAAIKGEQDLIKLVGADHKEVAKLRAEAKAYEKAMFQELTRIGKSYESELEITKSREAVLLNKIREFTQTNSTANEATAELRELERVSETYRSLYAAALQRNQEAQQQQSFLGSEARIITSAKPPIAPAGQRPVNSLVLSLLIGGLAGAGLGYLREYFDKTLRTRRQVRQTLGIDRVWILPTLVPDQAGAAPESKAVAEPLGPAATTILPTSMGAPPIWRHILKYPNSAYTEALRAAKVNIDHALPNRSSRTIGVISLVHGEGKSTVAKNLGSLIAHMGFDTLLIDADLRNQGLTRGLAPSAEVGLVDTIDDFCRLKDSLASEPESGLRLLLAGSVAAAYSGVDVVASPAMPRLLRQAAAQFAYVLIDLPPFAHHVDVQTLAPHVDGFLLVVEWGKTSSALLQHTLALESVVREKCIGVLLNKTDVKKLELYEISTGIPVR